MDQLVGNDRPGERPMKYKLIAIETAFLLLAIALAAVGILAGVAV